MENSKEQGKKKIQDEDLVVASGGGCGAGCAKFTCMRCKDRSCNYTEDWDGNYMNGKFYKCPQCGKMTFYGAMLSD